MILTFWRLCYWWWVLSEHVHPRTLRSFIGNFQPSHGQRKEPSENDGDFLNYHGIVHDEYMLKSQIISKILSLRRIQHKRLKYGCQAISSHALAQSLQLFGDFLAMHGIPQVGQPPYPPDIGPCDFWLLVKLKMLLKGRLFKSWGYLADNNGTAGSHSKTGIT